MPEEFLRLTTHSQNRSMRTRHIQTLRLGNHTRIAICSFHFIILRSNLELALIAQRNNDNVRTFLHALLAIAVLRCIVLSIFVPIDHNLIVISTIAIDMFQKWQEGIRKRVADGSSVFSSKHIAEMCCRVVGCGVLR